MELHKGKDGARALTRALCVCVQSEVDVVLNGSTGMLQPFLLSFYCCCCSTVLTSSTECSSVLCLYVNTVAGHK